MNRIVVKFGGSNLKSKDDIAKLIQVIGAYPVPIVIVISALFGITDYLDRSIQEVKKNEKAIDEIKRYLLKAHQQIIDQYIDDPQRLKEAGKKIRRRINDLGKYLLGVFYFGEIPDFARDMVLSYGERLSALVLNEILVFKRFDSQELLPEQIGLTTDGEFHNATVDFAKSKGKVRQRLNGRHIYVIPGFYGISPEGKVTLLGRGGSDYSAAAIAHCIQAESVDIWKDVAGYMSADPKLTPQSVNINRLSYSEAAELSYFGAKILHPRTFEPVFEENIPIRLFNINDFQGKIQPLTIIDHQGVIIDGVVKSVTYSDDLAILQLIGPGVGIKPGIMAKVTTVLSNARINIKSIITAQTSINILLSHEDVGRSYELVKSMGLATVDELKKIADISLIAIVGEGMLEMPGIAARVFSAVSREHINMRIISAGASPVAAYFIISQKERTRAIQAIHQEFFG